VDTSLNKYISETGFCSRREADKYIEQCRVTINGKEAHKGNRHSYHGPYHQARLLPGRPRRQADHLGLLVAGPAEAGTGRAGA